MDSFCLSFTGVGRELGRHERKIVGNSLKKVRRAPTLVHSGAQKGVDVLAANYALQLWQKAKHVVLIPTFCDEFREGKPRNVVRCKYDSVAVADLVELAEELGVDLVVKDAYPGIGKPAAGYLRRDDMLAQNCTHMMAFPNTGTEQRRSGTWATVRRGVANRRRILVTPLNGESPFKLGVGL